MKLTIIGGGPGGYTAAFAAAKAGVEVTLVERAHLGGTCLHTGCIPTKTLRSSADALDTVARLREFGIAGDCAATPDMSAIVARKRKVTATLQTGLEKTAAQLKVRVVRGDAEFFGAGLVRVASVDGSLEIAGDRVILATGSSPQDWPKRGLRLTSAGGSSSTIRWKRRSPACMPLATSPAHGGSCWHTWPQPKRIRRFITSCTLKRKKYNRIRWFLRPFLLRRKSAMWD